MRPTRARLSALLAAASLACTIAVLALVDRAGAVSTRAFELDDAASLAAGDLVRTAVHSDGRVTTGVELRRIAMPEDVASVWSWARSADGTLYVGTGNDGRIYRVRGEAVDLFAQTGQLLVSALAWVGGTLYAGTLPEGRIYAIDAAGTVRELARPDGAEHVWALLWDPRRGVLFAATGPEGRVYAITPSTGAVDLWWDAPAAHVMSLVLGDDGALYAGTSDDAVLARTTAPGRAEIVHDFPGNEITALAWRGGRLAVAANEFPDPPAVSSGSGGATKHSATGTRAARPRPGKARVWSVGADGRVERVWAQEEGHVTQLEIAADGVIFAAIGHEGRVVRIAPDRTSAVWVDVDERQVLAIDLADSAEPFFATADGAAIYRVLPERPATAIWQSKVLDAEFVARFGQLTWRGSGTLEFQTRTGNTERPDETWSEWSSSLTSPGPIRSPAARFLQIRALFRRDPDATLRAVTAYYLPQNQRPVVTEIGTKQRRPTPAPSGASGAAATADRDAPPTPSTTIGLVWKVDNPDADRLRFRLRFREESQSLWREMLREHETLSATEYAWNTAGVPDGWYVIEVEASDELANPEPLALRSSLASEPILVDNHPPSIEDLRATGARVSGRAVDALGPIARLEYAVDGGEWRLFFPVDDLLDTREERFELDFGAQSPGSHIVAVRAFDAAGNSVTEETTITVPAGGGAASKARRGGRPP